MTGDVAVGDAALRRSVARLALFADLDETEISAMIPLFEEAVYDEGGAAVARAGDVERAQPARADGAVQVHVEEVEAGHGAEVAEETGLDVLRPQRLPQERVREQVDLADREVVGGAPVGVDLAEQFRRERAVLSSGSPWTRGAMPPVNRSSHATPPRRMFESSAPTRR